LGYLFVNLDLRNLRITFLSPTNGHADAFVDGILVLLYLEKNKFGSLF
jgi:hypothetical protein